MRLSRPFIINTVAAVCVISVTLLTLHTYNPNISLPKLSLHPTGATAAAPYHDNSDSASDLYHHGDDVPAPTQRANATLLMLARNSDVNSAVITVKDLEDRFNGKYKYPWVFLNEQPFSDDFKRRVSLVVSGQVYFGQIPEDHWYQPSWINETKATEGRHKMEEENVIYGGSVSYRNMCRFNSGFFYRHALLQNYRYYWRVEPGVRFHCDILSDPFLFMQENNKIYGFTITMYEFERTIETLWATVREFVAEHSEFVSPNSAMNFLSDNGGDRYNLCHFWSNFEIADLDFWRGPAYTAFFDFLESRGGFYYERWGDAPVHSIAAALFGGTDKIHFFREIGYEHPPYTHCPAEEDLWRQGRCTCDPAQSFDYDGYSCLWRWNRMNAN
jgi:alpha 1,2-mannosyltransferase